ncbi:UPF0149 family protein [Janthinobacterium agaricidamnosum]|uniref:YecA family protein n=1 Tax=Janthinobacterium agaricidamnosum NBRC 102515 = DSM 9628 TaxID=1349767 RepID=W0V616_9BURK|nr:UPF0149 family protein [Janthinobacterium agaricidamnosum]CDG82798.1 yecA family protein [Janthinobacterium agaricidamnosum NBRC 102515 = DSM 9628]
MSSLSATTPLSDDEYAELDTLLAAPALAGRAMDVSMLEGLLTAVALSPNPIAPEQWLPWMWDKAAGAAAPEAGDATQGASALARRHHAYMVEWLAKDPDSFEPIYACGPEWGVPAWCAGFLLGTALDQPQWAALHASHPHYLAPFRHLAAACELDDAAAEAAMDGVVPAVIAINAAWARQRHLKQNQPGATVLRDLPKTGRNDPCHCGSGKKYKKCCADGDSAAG